MGAAGVGAAETGAAGTGAVGPDVGTAGCEPSGPGEGSPNTATGVPPDWTAVGVVNATSWTLTAAAAANATRAIAPAAQGRRRPPPTASRARRRPRCSASVDSAERTDATDGRGAVSHSEPACAGTRTPSA